MYAKGDKIVYPPYGAGVIDDIEEKEVDGQWLTYYVLYIPVGNLKIMISAAKAGSLGVREIYPKGEMLGVIQGVLDEPIVMSDNWNQRYKDNMERIKSGNLAEVALVYRNLMLRERERGLSTAEKKMMTTAKQIILSELILSQEVDKPEAEKILDTTFG
ncbi:MAG: CarD family transcriptional regulator [Defluviitaleaceae bacterium]|nr:CarD family transcriptional regulator [Defluviitaleaceae bacterium]MCL2239177.1 CarD family transcriptional regulator [Defluviitaleaceae bacterium]